MYNYNQLNQSLIKGYISEYAESKLEFLPEFITNDSKTHKRVLTTIINELNNCDEFWFSVAFVTTSGVASLINTLIELKDKNIKGKIVASNYLNFTQPIALERLLLNFPNIELRVIENLDFHAKGYLFRKGEIYNLVIGSSNITSSALSKNKEWNLKISAHSDSYIMRKALGEFKNEFNNATIVTIKWLKEYEIEYQRTYSNHSNQLAIDGRDIYISPNQMQKNALKKLKELRDRGENKALIISATGTGKTFLAAFDVAEFKPKRCLFIVHRRNIAEAAMKTFMKRFGVSKKYGLYSGTIRDIDVDFLFSTIQTITQDEHLTKFKPDDFDYIILDETHRAAAESYQKVLGYFKPKFLLGMTATPERTDGADIFALFNHNIAYEIRLHQAIENNLLCEFHYYGVQDLLVNGSELDNLSYFKYIEFEQRVAHILKTIKLYGTDNNKVRGLIFCSKKEECFALSEAFNKNGFKTIALIGEKSDNEARSRAIELLESDTEDKLDYIFTVDIFNEGVDIPKVNQIILLRPTNSVIVFVQQIGRGLRKFDGKQYVTIIDFVGNYQTSNYLIPIALYGDTTYNKDTLRKMIFNGSRLIPGTSTINFDKITKEKIYSSIDSSNLQTSKDLKKDYDLLKYKIGKYPLMMDFMEKGLRDPFHYIKYSKDSFYSYVSKMEDELLGTIIGKDLILLKYFSKEINNSKRIEESLILRQILNHGFSSFENINSELNELLGYTIDEATFHSALNNLSLKFNTEKYQKSLINIATIYSLNVLVFSDSLVVPAIDLKNALENKLFCKFLLDSTEFSISKFLKEFKLENFIDGFVLYRKYSRKDVFRILNWDVQPLEQNVGGYIFHPNDLNCPIFVNYHKEENISESIKYEDGFIDPYVLVYESKNKRTLNSPDVVRFKNAVKMGIRLPLFVKKHNGEGDDFYFMGDVTPIDDSFIQKKAKGQNLVQMSFRLNIPVESDLFEYITKGNI